MKSALVYIADRSPALDFASGYLAAEGICITTIPCEAVTHVLLPVPTKSWTPPEELPANVTVFGGNLPQTGLNTVDLLKDEAYLLQNAAITAHCAIKIAMNHLPSTLYGLNALVIGWGRIGKSLTALLHALGARVTVATRDPAAIPVPYKAVDTASLDPSPYRLIFNTAPVPVLDSRLAAPNALLIDLASKLGISGDRVIWARGLPGKEAPESSGALIAQTVIRYLSEKENV